MLLEILAVPPAISSALDLARQAIRELIHRKAPDLERQSLDKLEEKLCEVKDRLMRFSEFGIEMSAWKEVHRLTNRLQFDLRQTFSA